MAWRAAAFTAEDARNGLGFRGLDGIRDSSVSFRLSANYRYHIHTLFVRLSGSFCCLRLSHHRDILT